MAKEVALLGVGMHPWGKWPEKNFRDYGLTAANKALKDADLEWTDIQFVAGGSTIYSGTPGLLSASVLAEEMGYTGIPVINDFNACATGSYAIDIARARIMAGLCDIALCIGMDQAPKGFFAPVESDDPKDLDSLRFKMGATNPTYFGLSAMRRMQIYGATDADFAKVKVKNSLHGLNNPNARFKKEFTMEEVLNSPMVAYPLRLLELCATSDGAAAVILSSMETARKYTNKPITVAAVSALSPIYPEEFNIPIRISSDSSYSTSSYKAPFQKMVVDKAYEEAGLGPEDLDLAEVYDLSTSMELDWYEYLGLCEPGEAERLLNDGETTIGGKIPVNPSGGLSCFGEAVPAQAISQICELVWQLRGQTGQRQVEGAKTGITTNIGLQGNCSSVIVKR